MSITKNTCRAIYGGGFAMMLALGLIGCSNTKDDAQPIEEVVETPMLEFVEAPMLNYERVPGHNEVERVVSSIHHAPQQAYSNPHNPEMNTNSFTQKTENGFKLVSTAPLSTFSSDVDTASYAIVRKQIEAGTLPSSDMVRIEEMLNSFRYNLPAPKDAPIGVSLELSNAMWNEQHKILRIGLAAKEIDWKNRKPFNLVFLIDTSGSMQGEHRIGLVQKSLKMLVENLGEADSVGIVTYAGDSRIALQPTKNKQEIIKAIESLSAYGNTHGSAGITTAYELAQKHFKKGGYNRVILATDGDFNVGITSESDLLKLVKEKAKGGVYLSVFGYGMGNYKDSMLQKLADNGNGNYGYIDNILEAKKHLVEQVGANLITVAKDVKIQVEFNPVKVSAYRLIGYEKRLLEDRDFNDDSKDAGEMGSGHNVVALYEIVPVGVKLESSTPLAPDSKGVVDPLKYSQNIAKQGDNGDLSDEWATVKVRYKEPANQASSKETSKLLSFSLDSHTLLNGAPAISEQGSKDMMFAQSVAAFGMLLSDSPFKGDTSYTQILNTLGREGVCNDSYKQEFLGLVATASRLKP